jgi:5'-nucleotidase
MSIDRRHFLKQSALAGGAVISSSLLPKNLFADNEEKNLLTILHTNDVHSHLEPFPFDSGQYAGLGGVAARAALIKQIRSDNEQVLLLDAGDIFQGTPYFNIYKGEPDMKAMSIMGYEATTMGNHDFDAGLENFATQLQFAKFPVIICNYDFSHTPMEGKYVPYKIFQKGKMKIGVLGVGIELKGLVPDELFGNTIYLEPIEQANRTAAYLRKQGCDLIVCLSHLGDRYFDDKVSDEILAKECFDIDLIIGGHTHKFFDAPRVYRNRNNGNTLVNQVGWAGLQLGRLDYSLARSQKKSLIKAHTVVIREKTNE